jgi:hypothetical protein
MLYREARKMPNGGVDAAASNCVTDKLSIRSSLIPLASNDLLSRPDCNALPVFCNQGTGERGVIVAVEVCLSVSRAARVSDKPRAGSFWFSKSEAG